MVPDAAAAACSKQLRVFKLCPFLTHTPPSSPLAGRGAVVTHTSNVVVVHKDHHMLGARITVVRVSGSGQDSVFLAALEVTLCLERPAQWMTVICGMHWTHPVASWVS